MKYVTIKDKAIEWNITERQVQNYCRKGRILDATKQSGVWQILKMLLNHQTLTKHL